MMVVGLVSCELHLPSARSLKDKRRIVKSLIERVHQRYRVSIAETNYHDLHQRAELGVAIVASSEHEVGELLDRIRTLADNEMEAFVTAWEPQILEEGR